jgi:hypothetical protein
LASEAGEIASVDECNVCPRPASDAAVTAPLMPPPMIKVSKLPFRIRSM